MNHYETVFILTPVLSDVQMKEAVEKFKTILTEQGAVIVNEENWGLRKLAYPIQKKTTGSDRDWSSDVCSSDLPCWNSTPNLLSSLNWKSNSVVTNV